ncbi:ABC transporter ATP-binding protein [Streptosporangium violaceochromogenes]|nr:ABC transporter ATP-binding protein [Streptosporangium violaceochromogenes]
MAATGEPILRVRDLVKHFPLRHGPLRAQVGLIKAVDGVSFDLGRGETLGVVGESGCGKSTLARLLLGLERPTSGSVTVGGGEITRARGGELKRLRRNIQMIMQDPYASLNPRMTVGDIVGEPYEIHRDAVPKGDRRRRVRELLEIVGLNPDHADRYPHQFSGGQRRRVGIARGLALQPEIIVCDEPVSSLDVSIRAQIVNLLGRLQDELGLSYVFIAHDLSVVRHISDRVGVMYLGKLVELGGDGEIYGHPAHPYTQALLSAVPVPDPEGRERRRRIILQGDPPSPITPPSGCRFRTRCWKARDVCAEREPPLRALSGTGHAGACHFAEPREAPPPA